VIPRSDPTRGVTLSYCIAGSADGDRLGKTQRPPLGQGIIRRSEKRDNLCTVSRTRTAGSATPCCGPAPRTRTEPVRMRGPNGVVVEVIRYVDKLGYDRKVYRLSQHGVFIGEYKTPEELARHVDLAELVEDDPAPPTT
jgi:hypothetical protein